MPVTVSKYWNTTGLLYIKKFIRSNTFPRILDDRVVDYLKMFRSQYNRSTTSRVILVHMRQCAVKVTVRSYANYVANITTASTPRVWHVEQQPPPAELTKRLRKHHLKERNFYVTQRFCNLKDVIMIMLINVGLEITWAPVFDTNFMYSRHNKFTLFKTNSRTSFKHTFTSTF
jgi:hypothetical protein